jgi:hypothetical protein
MATPVLEASTLALTVCPVPVWATTASAKRRKYEIFIFFGT